MSYQAWIDRIARESRARLHAGARLFTIIATLRATGRVSFDTEVRITVEARTLHDAYRAVRELPQFKHAHLRPE